MTLYPCNVEYFVMKFNSSQPTIITNTKVFFLFVSFRKTQTFSHVFSSSYICSQTYLQNVSSDLSTPFCPMAFTSLWLIVEDIPSILITNNLDFQQSQDPAVMGSICYSADWLTRHVINHRCLYIYAYSLRADVKCSLSSKVGLVL